MELARAIDNLNFSELDFEIKRTIKRSAKEMVRLGYMLRRMMEQKLYLNQYSCFDEYLSAELHMDYTMASRFIGANKKYAAATGTEIAKKWEGYSQSVLIEMLTMPPEQEEQVTPDMTVKQVREIKRQEKQKEAAVQQEPEKETVTDAEFREIPTGPEEVATSQLCEEEVPHDTDWFIRQYVKTMPHEASGLFEICRKEQNNSDRAKAIKEHIAPYGLHVVHCSEYDFRFGSFAQGLDFRIGEEEQHLKYGALAKGLMKMLEEQENTEAGSIFCPVPGEIEPPESVPETPETDRLQAVEEILRKEQKLLDDYLEVGGIPEATLERQKIIAGALAAMLSDLENNPVPGPQPELPVLKNNDQRKEWLKNYKDWGLWYRDGNLDVNYYKYDFPDGSRLVVAEYLQRAQYWDPKKLYDERHYHLLEKDRKGYNGALFDTKYCHTPDSETYLVEFLKNLQKK